MKNTLFIATLAMGLIPPVVGGGAVSVTKVRNDNDNDNNDNEISLDDLTTSVLTPIVLIITYRIRLKVYVLDAMPLSNSKHRGEGIARP